MNKITPVYLGVRRSECRIRTHQFKEYFLAAAGLLCVAASQGLADRNQAFLPTPPEDVSTMPPNGDQNPYGVAFVPPNFHPACNTSLIPGDVLVSNFNNKNNLQGTGTTIVRVSSTGPVTTFFTVPSAVLGGPCTGLSTALALLSKGYVIVGSVPSSDGTTATSGPGSLLVIDSMGNLVRTITDPTINGPWDMTVIDHGDNASAFVSNVFAGTVVRFDLKVGSNGVTVTNRTVIASGYQHRPDSVAFAVGPTGLVLDGDTLYVASTEDNAIFAVSGASGAKRDMGKGKLIYSDPVHLHGPLGMIKAPNGHLLVANSDVINSDPTQPSEIVEFTEQGEFIKQLSVDPAQGGSFGLATAEEMHPDASILAAVDDNSASLILYTLPPK